MGNYNSQYESYYSSMVNRRRNPVNSGYRRYNPGFKLDGNFLIKRIVRDLIGVFILFFFITICKLVSIPQTAAAYNFSKQMVDSNYDYKAAFIAIKSFDAQSVEDKVTNWIDTAKSKILGGKTLKEKLKTDFIVPVEGTIVSHFGESSKLAAKDKNNEGVDIQVKADSEVLNPFEGKIKDCGEDGQQGKYVLVDHGNGIETRYTQLKSYNVKKGDTVKKGQVIGKGGNVDSTKPPLLHFELLYMGENKNPEDYLSFAK